MYGSLRFDEIQYVGERAIALTCERWITGEPLFLVHGIFLLGQLQRIFICDKIQDVPITQDKALDSLMYHVWIAFLCHHIQEVQNFKNGPFMAHPVRSRSFVPTYYDASDKYTLTAHTGLHKKISYSAKSGLVTLPNIYAYQK